MTQGNRGKGVPLAAGGPDFIGIGPGKAGTTWIWQQLRRHPQVFLPDEKEIHYFDPELYGPEGGVNLRAERPIDWYISQFDGAADGQRRGEITPSYFNSRSAPERVKAFRDDLALFSVIRNPRDRLLSMYLFALQRGEIADVPLEDAIERYPHFLERCRQAPALERWLTAFDDQQLRVFRYDDLRADPNAFLLELERYLGVEEFIPTAAAERVNETGEHRFPRVNRALMSARLTARRSRTTERAVEFAKRAGLGKGFSWLQGQVKPFDELPKLSPQMTARLDDLYAADIAAVEVLTGLDLTTWKSNDS